MPASLEPESLCKLFCEDPAEIGTFEEVAQHDAPPDIQTLLAHDDHMTVTVEAFHNSLVDLSVLGVKQLPIRYAREILLALQSDGSVVQYGIVAIDLELLPSEVADEVTTQGQPLGRILIRNNVLRRVELGRLFRVTMGKRLARCFGSQKGDIVYGRTAQIHVEEKPAIDLLEIVMTGRNDK